MAVSYSIDLMEELAKVVGRAELIEMIKKIRELQLSRQSKKTGRNYSAQSI